jgi:hypothetical protein
MPHEDAPTDAAPPQEHRGGAGNDDRAASSSGAAPAPPTAAPDGTVDVAPPAVLASAAPAAADSVAQPLAGGLPTLAPVRVILNAPRDESGRPSRSADIERLIISAGLEVSSLAPANPRRPGPSIGYYFESDRHAAAEISHLLEPLLGPVDPVAFKKAKSIPEPGTIEIAIP